MRVTKQIKDNRLVVAYIWSSTYQEWNISIAYMYNMSSKVSVYDKHLSIGIRRAVRLWCSIYGQQGAYKF